MLTEKQITKLNHQIRQEEVMENPTVTLIRAAKRANLPFKDVMEYVITRALQDAHTNISDTVNGSPPVLL